MRPPKLLLVGSAIGLLALSPVRADVRLPGIFGDHMVLQQDINIPVWGWATPGEAVTVSLGEKRAQTTADPTGAWRVSLAPSPPRSAPLELVVAGRNTLVLRDVLVGEVWLASGQSNMGYPVASADHASTEIPRADDPHLRLFTVIRKTSVERQPDLQGRWEVCAPTTVKNFSAVAYFFGRELRVKLGRPVGLINSSWGGTSAQTWLSIDALRLDPPFTRHVKQWDEALATHRRVIADPQIASGYLADLKRWQTDVAPGFNAATKAFNAPQAPGQAPGAKPVPSRPEPTNPDPMGMPSPAARPSTPSVIFNAMIAPLTPFALRGIIWYQGEANGGAGLEYRTLFPRLIADWRAQWGQGDFPFLFVQLPGWDQNQLPADQHDWPFLREAQLTTLTQPRTGMAVAIDLGDPANVHPKGKIDVALRLALAARRVAYGESLVASGPLYRSFVIENGAVRVRFTELGGGLVIGRSPWRPEGVAPLSTSRLLGFALAGADRKWIEAEATVSGDTVLVSSPLVPAPVAVRYAWANSPLCNLYNREGLPASPFRTDDWPKATLSTFQKSP